MYKHYFFNFYLNWKLSFGTQRSWFNVVNDYSKNQWKMKSWCKAIDFLCMWFLFLEPTGFCQEFVYMVNYMENRQWRNSPFGLTTGMVPQPLISLKEAWPILDWSLANLQFSDGADILTWNWHTGYSAKSYYQVYMGGGRIEWELLHIWHYNLQSPSYSENLFKC